MTTILIISIIAIIAIFALFYFRKNPPKTFQASSTQIENYIGKVYTLEFPVIHGTGILQIDQTTWRVNCIDLPAGARIKITGVKGMILLAEPHAG